MGKKPKNIILIVVDSLRYDAVYDQGVGLPYTEQNAVQFSQARSAGCWTLPATTSLFTGLMPHEHEATCQSRGFRDNIPTLAEKLKEQDYSTYQITANPVTTDIFGLDRGFDYVYKVWQHVPAKFQKLLNVVLMMSRPRIRKVLLSKDFVTRKMTEDMRVGISWTQNTHQDIFNYTRKTLQENESKGKGSFLFLNLMEAHFPYHVDAKFRPSAEGLFDKIKELNALFHTVNQSFLKKDKVYIQPHIEKIIRERQYKSWTIIREALDDFIRELHQDKDNLVILCSDHGENFGDQGWIYHFSNVTDGGNRVPLFWLAPGANSPQNMDFPVSSRYVYDEILAACGIPSERQATLFRPEADNLPVLQSYWYSNQGKTLDKYKFNQLCFVENEHRYVWRDDVNRNFQWMYAPVKGKGEEPLFEPLGRNFDPVEEIITDLERKNYLKKTLRDFTAFSEKIDKWSTG